VRQRVTSSVQGLTAEALTARFSKTFHRKDRGPQRAPVLRVMGYETAGDPVAIMTLFVRFVKKIL
jgi:hypothetical protein